jgi:hypothetical protein
MESTEESQQGYPEEAPPGADPAGGGGRPSEKTPQREGSKPARRHDDQAGDTDDGKATGNPRSAG